jgi:hypothetical protein
MMTGIAASAATTHTTTAGSNNVHEMVPVVLDDRNDWNYLNVLIKIVRTVVYSCFLLDVVWVFDRMSRVEVVVAETVAVHGGSNWTPVAMPLLCMGGPMMRASGQQLKHHHPRRK